MGVSTAVTVNVDITITKIASEGFHIWLEFVLTETPWQYVVIAVPPTVTA